MSRKVLKHPDKEAIIEKLNNGESVREIEAFLKQKYPGNKNMWLSFVTLQKFRKGHLQLEGKVLKDIQEAGKMQKQVEDEQKRQLALESTDAYKKKINEIADAKLDVARKILELDKVIESRMEYWYNAVASGEAVAAKGDKELRQFIDRQMNLLAQYKKFVEGLADRTVDYNVNVTVMNDQIVAIRTAIQECLAEFEPDVAFKFLEKLNMKMKNMSYRAELPQPVKLEDLQEAEFEPLEDGELNNGQ